MKKFKPETVVRRLAKIEQNKVDEQARYSKAMYQYAADIEAVQDRCPHPDIKCNWNNTWDGWDQHDDLKGHYDYICTTCKKRLRKDVVKSEHEKLRHNIRQACGLE